MTIGYGYGSLLWCNVGITSAGAKALHLNHNSNDNNNNDNNNNNYNNNPYSSSTVR